MSSIRRAAVIAALFALAATPGCDCGKPKAPKARLSPKPKPKALKRRIKVRPQLRSQMRQLNKLFSKIKRRLGRADASRIIAAIKGVGDFMLTQQRGAAPYQELVGAFDLLQRRETAVARFIALDIKRASRRESDPNAKPAKVGDKERAARQAAVAALRSAYRDVIELCVKCHKRKARRALRLMGHLRL